ncbi:MAG: TonB-dependent receptor [Bacteroidales bacterium]|nr:TonB-dependent receptor [Bacteroidales bacterium]
MKSNNNIGRWLPILFMLIAPLSASAQTSTVSGTVRDSSGQPVPGAAVMVAGTTTGTVTDFDGNYTISIKPGDKINVSFVGFSTETQQYNGQAEMNFTLTDDAMELDEIVAVGYGVMRKSDLTGAVTSVKADALQQTPASGLDQALQGRAAGVTVNSGTGQPGAAAEIRIRGIGSVVGDCSPIYVVNGIITDDISFLSPSDIVSTEILKDASATAIYGSRGANGVILVTTKQGEKGDGKITADAYYGFQNRWRKLDLMSRDEFAMTKLRIDVMKNGVGQLADFLSDGFNEWMNVYNIGKSDYSPRPLSAKTPNGFDYSAVDTDWQDEVFRSNAKVQNYSVSATGGNDRGRYAFSANWFQQDGTIIGSDYQRFTVGINADYKVKDWLKLGSYISFATSKGRNAMNNNSSPGASVISAALAMAPWDPVRYPEGSISASGTRDLSNQIAASTNFKNVVNPISMVEHSHPEDKNERLLGNLNFDVTPIEGLTWHTAISLDMTVNRSRLFKEKYEHSSYDKAEKSFVSSNISRASTFSEETTVTYLKDIDRHTFSVMLGQTMEQYVYYNIGGSGASITNAQDPNNWYLNQATEDRTEAGDGVARNRRLSFLGRVHYSFADRYLATFNFRADGSSKFPQNTWGFFPSFALAWRISEEGFMQDQEVFSHLKLRVGWGRVGNDKVGDDAFTQTMFTSGPSFVDYTLGVDQQPTSGAAVLTQVNNNGKWENNEQLDAGIDFGVLGGALSGSVDLFLRDTKEALLYVETPAHVGNRYSPLANVGKLRNRGVEVALDYNTKFGPVDFTVGGNVSFIKNELKELNGGQPLWGDRTVCNEGLAMNTFWGFTYEGVYQTDVEAQMHQWAVAPEEITVHAGDAKYKDLNGDGRIDNDDREDLGNPFPWLTFGANIQASAWGFDLQAFFQGQHGNKIYNALRERTEGTGDECTLSTDMRNVWIGYSDAMRKNFEKRGIDWTTLENREGTIPNPAGASSNKYNNSRLIEDGGYFRLKTLQLGYTLPKRAVQKIKMEKIRVYANCTNLFTITDYTGYDPEVFGGVDYGNYPQSRTVTFGINLSL